MTVSLQFAFLVFLAALISGGLGTLTHEIFAQWLHAPSWVCLWAALCVALFCMAVIRVS